MEDPYKGSGSNYTSGQAPAISGGQPIFPSVDQPAIGGTQPLAFASLQGSASNAQPVSGGQPLSSDGFGSGAFGAQAPISAPTPMPMQSQPLSSATGDIILNNGGGKKSKKGLIIGIAVIAVLLIATGGLAVAYFMNNGNGGGKTSGGSVVAATDKSLFYSYANDILYGTDSTEPITGELSSSQYAYRTKIYNGSDSDQEYFNQIYQKYMAFYNRIQEESNVDSGLKLAAENHKQLLDFLMINPMSANYDYNHIIDVYIDNGADAATNEVDRILATMPANNSYAEDFMEYLSIELSTTVPLMQYLEAYGCIANGEIDEVCLYTADIVDEDGVSMQDTVMNNEAEAHDLLNSYIKQIGTDCWHLKKIIDGEYLGVEN